LTGLIKDFGEMVLIAPRIFISILSISLISNNIAASASLLAKRGAASLASLQATSLLLLPLLPMAGVLDSRRWTTEMIRLVHSWEAGNPIYKSLKKTLDKEEGGRQKPWCRRGK
jgi:hypothetical protein